AASGGTIRAVQVALVAHVDAQLVRIRPQPVAAKLHLGAHEVVVQHPAKVAKPPWHATIVAWGTGFVQWMDAAVASLVAVAPGAPRRRSGGCYCNPSWRNGRRPMTPSAKPRTSHR